MIGLLGCVFAPTELTLAPAACTQAEDEVDCPFSTVTFWKGLSGREVHVQVPLGEPPPDGWPTVLYFQGSLNSAQDAWHGVSGEAFGGLHEARLLATLLESGFAVVAPEAGWDGHTWWATNVWPTSFWWESGDDHELMTAIFSAIEAGDLGPLDADRLYATGISSGGYMTSRMALSYPGTMRALAIQSASWATCGGALCVIGAIPGDHPPTLLLHGEDDAIVPIGTMLDYADALEDAGIEHEVVREPGAGHAWSADAPDRVTEWFLAR